MRSTSPYIIAITSGFLVLLLSISNQVIAQDPLLLQMKSQYFDYDTGDWKEGSKALITYDQFGKPIQITEYGFFDAEVFNNDDCKRVWLKTFEALRKYDERDSLILNQYAYYFHSVDWDDPSCSLETDTVSTKEEYVYNNRGQLTKEIYSHVYKRHGRDEWAKYTTDYTHDENACLIQINSEIELSNGDHRISHTVYTRDPNCRLISEEDEDQRSDYYYNDSGLLTTTYLFLNTNNQWILSLETVNIYDESGVIIEKYQWEYQNTATYLTKTQYNTYSYPISRIKMELDLEGSIVDTVEVVNMEWDGKGNQVYLHIIDKISEWLSINSYEYGNNNELFKEEFSIEYLRYDSTHYFTYNEVADYEYDDANLMIHEQKTYEYEGYKDGFFETSFTESEASLTYRCDKALEEIVIESFRSFDYPYLTDESTAKLRQTYHYTEAICDGADDSRVLAIYPNPSSGRFKVECGLLHQSGTTISVFDLKGREYYSDLAPIRYETEVDIRNLPPGVYIITLRNQSQKTSGRAIIY